MPAGMPWLGMLPIAQCSPSALMESHVACGEPHVAGCTLGLDWVSHAAARLHVVLALHCLPRYGLAVGVKEVDRLLVALRMEQPLRMEPPECLQRSGRMLRTTLPPGVLHGMCLPPGATRCMALGRMQPAAPYGVQGVLPLRNWDVV